MKKGGIAVERSLSSYAGCLLGLALGDGLVDIFRNLNVDQVVDGGQTMNPSIQDLAQAVEACHAKNVFILPNNTNIILAAQQAAQICKNQVKVIPTKNVAMGIAAAIAFQPEQSAEDNAAEMEEVLKLKANVADVYTKNDTDSAIAAAIANVDHLSREIVDILPDIEDANPNTIYMTPSGL